MLKLPSSSKRKTNTIDGFFYPSIIIKVLSVEKNWLLRKIRNFRSISLCFLDMFVCSKITINQRKIRKKPILQKSFSHGWNESRVNINIRALKLFCRAVSQRYFSRFRGKPIVSPFKGCKTRHYVLLSEGPILSNKKYGCLKKWCKPKTQCEPIYPTFCWNVWQLQKLRVPVR